MGYEAGDYQHWKLALLDWLSIEHATMHFVAGFVIFVVAVMALRSDMRDWRAPLIVLVAALGAEALDAYDVIVKNGWDRDFPKMLREAGYDLFCTAGIPFALTVLARWHRGFRPVGRR